MLQLRCTSIFSHRPSLRGFPCTSSSDCFNQAKRRQTQRSRSIGFKHQQVVQLVNLAWLIVVITSMQNSKNDHSSFVHREETSK